MTRDNIIRMAAEAGVSPVNDQQIKFEGPMWLCLERFAALVAAEKEQQMLRDGWRQCAKGQRTTQYCGLLDAAVEAEREACAKVCEETTAAWTQYFYNSGCVDCAVAIRARNNK